MFSLASKLISFKSHKNNLEAIRAALKFIEEYAKTHGLIVKKFSHHKSPSILLLLSTRGIPDILMVGHLDVVEGEASQFKAVIRGDRLFGRGAFDMKGPLAVMIEALAELKKNKSLNAGLLITTDEERGGFIGTGRFIKNLRRMPKLVIVPDGGNNFSVASGGKGNASLVLTAIGKSAHASRPWEGSNAIIHIVKAVNRVSGKFSGQGETTTTITPISIATTNHGPNVVPHLATLKYSIRFTNDFNFALLEKTLKSQKDATVEIVRRAEPYSANLSNPEAKEFLNLMKHELGKKIVTSLYPSTCDARFFAYRRVPVIVTRPAGGDAHGPNEWISFKGLVKFKQILIHFLSR